MYNFLAKPTNGSNNRALVVETRQIENEVWKMCKNTGEVTTWIVGLAYKKKGRQKFFLHTSVIFLGKEQGVAVGGGVAGAIAKK